MIATLMSTPASLMAQMPGAPTLQNAFAAGGITTALDFSTLGASSTYAAAAGWAPASGRFQLSLGAGAQLRSGAPTRTVYGIRANVPIYGATGRLGASVFGGYGGLSGGKIDSTVAKSLVPVGATVSFRFAGATGRGFSVYASPLYEWVTRGDSAKTATVMRGAAGLDVGLTPAIGVTLGVEIGKRYDASAGKPSGTAFGVAVSYALGRRS